jgi:hypothetical protein
VSPRLLRLRVAHPHERCSDDCEGSALSNRRRQNLRAFLPLAACRLHACILIVGLVCMPIPLTPCHSAGPLDDAAGRKAHRRGWRIRDYRLLQIH